ncbi:DUF6366 family protein [Peribacillus frigoritolerans]
MKTRRIKRKPSSSVHGGDLADLVGSLGWKVREFLFL